MLLKANYKMKFPKNIPNCPSCKKNTQKHLLGAGGVKTTNNINFVYKCLKCENLYAVKSQMQEK